MLSLRVFVKVSRGPVVLLVNPFTESSLLTLVRRNDRFFENGTLIEIVDHDGFIVDLRILVTPDHKQGQLIFDGAAKTFLARGLGRVFRGEFRTPSPHHFIQTRVCVFFPPCMPNLFTSNGLRNRNDIV